MVCYNYLSSTACQTSICRQFFHLQQNCLPHQYMPRRGVLQPAHRVHKVQKL
nr:hypothetical protein Iba_chr01dCG14880 [Ipomoea batatas]GMC54767.1 hypothetical protein Iba_chr01eCG1030 [Ipomoea batatas]GMC57903.1 hypothetical protein Iba_scaffold31264CG0030 [Ipomoea batatas]GMC74214.1 hypothetical protein Iba_chr03cCG8120 [Ipomoea batatas]GMD47204.1 hypothetical protein Iba_chr10eCG10660 [Ipomoea batatas]